LRLHLRALALRFQGQAFEQLAVLLGLRVRRGQEAIAVEDGIGARHEAQGLQRLVHLLAASRQANHRGRHHDARHGKCDDCGQ
jgi:hypothetical protein